MLVNKITGKQQPPPSDTQIPVQQVPPPGYYPPIPVSIFNLLFI